MPLETKIYSFIDMHEIDEDERPSLDIPHIIVDSALVPDDGGKYMFLLTHVSRTYKPEGGCPYCHSMDLKREGYGEPRLIHDVIRNNYRVDFSFRAPKMSCKTCKSRFTPEIKGIVPNKQMTVRLDEFLRKECFLQPHTLLAERTGFSEAYISRLMEEEADKLDAARALEPHPAPRVLGIDEKHLRKVERGVLANIETGDLIDILIDSKKNTMQEAIMSLDNWDKNIEVVTTDMNSGYASWIREILPNVVVVIDRFHVISDVERKITASKKHIEKSIKTQLKEIDDNEERLRKAAVLKIATSNRRLFNYGLTRLSREEERDRSAKLATVIAEFPEYKMLHDLHVLLDLMYMQTTLEAATEYWNEWKSLLPPEDDSQYAEWCEKNNFDPACFEEFRSLSRHGFMKHESYILNYFNSVDTRVTNAVTEGLNSLIENVNFAGKGYSFKNLRAKCLYASLIHQRINYGIDIRSVVIGGGFSSIMGDFSMPGQFGFGGHSSSGYKLDKWYFTKKKKKCSFPLPNALSDNDWLWESIGTEDMPSDPDDVLTSCDEEDFLFITEEYYAD